MIVCANEYTIFEREFTILLLKTESRCFAVAVVVVVVAPGTVQTCPTRNKRDRRGRGGPANTEIDCPPSRRIPRPLDPSRASESWSSNFPERPVFAAAPGETTGRTA